ncbi:MAG: hypothetical protein ABSF50_12305 [Burkholderiaceae bacterium]
MELTDLTRIALGAHPGLREGGVTPLIQRVRREMEGIHLFEFETSEMLVVSGCPVTRVLVPAMTIAEAMTFVENVSHTDPRSDPFLIFRRLLPDEKVTEPSLLLSKEGLIALASRAPNDFATSVRHRLQRFLDCKLTWRGPVLQRGVPDYVLIGGPDQRLAGVFDENKRSSAVTRERRSRPRA